MAYILPYETAANAQKEHRIYLKQMLLTEEGKDLIPQWAFFIRFCLNTSGLRPTASREDFYQDETLEQARQEIADAISQYLKSLKEQAPDRLQQILQIHYKAIQSMAVWDDEMFGIFIQHLPFETSEGTLMGAALLQQKKFFYAATVERFRQLKPIFLAQGQLLVCAGYTNIYELLIKMKEQCGCQIEGVNEKSLSGSLEMLTPAQRQKAATLLAQGSKALEEFDCQLEIRSFYPQELPALYMLNEDVRFVRRVQAAQEMATDSVLSEALDALLEDMQQENLGYLYLNLKCPLIEKLCEIADPALLKNVIRVLYTQALLTSGQPLHRRELRVLHQELLGLIEYKII